LKSIQQLPAILQHSKTPFTLYMLTLLTFSGATILFINDLVAQGAENVKGLILNRLKVIANLSDVDPKDDTIKTSTGKKLSEEGAPFLHNLDTISVVIVTDQNISQGTTSQNVRKWDLPNFVTPAPADPSIANITFENEIIPHKKIDHLVYVLNGGKYGAGIRDTIPQFKAYTSFRPLDSGDEYNGFLKYISGFSDLA
jgi:hypothetical protein